MRRETVAFCVTPWMSHTHAMITGRYTGQNAPRANIRKEVVRNESDIDISVTPNRAERCCCAVI